MEGKCIIPPWIPSSSDSMSLFLRHNPGRLEIVSKRAELSAKIQLKRSATSELYDFFSPIVSSTTLKTEKKEVTHQNLEVEKLTKSISLSNSYSEDYLKASLNCFSASLNFQGFLWMHV